MDNNVAFQFKDSGGTARRSALLSSTSSFYYGDVDNAVSGSKLLLLANDFITFSTNGTERARVTSGGLFGIGMTPTAGYGALQAYTGAGGTQIGIGLAATVGLLNYFGSDFQISSNATLSSGGSWTARYTAAALMELRGDGSIVFQSNTGLTAGNSFSPTERARFSSGGKFYVGQTASSSGGTVEITSTAEKTLSLNSSTSGPALFISSNYNGIQIQLGNNGNAGNISSSAGTTAYNTTSDIRRKEINVPQINYRDNINQLWVGNYTRYANFEHTGDNIEDFGVLAQQAHPLFSNAITKPDSDDGVWMADNSKFGLLALWGVKDLYKIIDELTTRLAALESK
jgi:hypothetical protein